MSNKHFKSSLFTSVAALAFVLGSASPQFAKAQDMDSMEGEDEMSMPPPEPAVASDPPAPMKKGMKKKDGMMGMGMMDDMMGMKDKPAMADDKMAAMPAKDAMPAMQAPMAARPNADMMGRMRGAMPERKGMNKMAAVASLPGFPGASRLYHVGATDFFLDHSKHITLSTEQRIALNQVKQKTMLDRTNFDRRIEDGEQLLWTMTAADKPDAVKIDAQVRAIEKHRGDQRLAFIRGVGSAAKLLTHDQHVALLGTHSPGVKAPATKKPAAMPAMPGMPDPAGKN